jgi:LAO/AO transport system kinase
VDEVWASIRRLYDVRRESGALDERRRTQAVRWMWSLVDEQVTRRLRHDPGTRDLADEMEIAVREGRLPAVEAAVRVVGRLLGDS